MDDDQKWLEAAAGLEQDILYLQAASERAATDLASDIERLKLAVAVFKKNASAGVAWPSPDDLFCINTFSSLKKVSTVMRRDFRLAY